MNDDVRRYLDGELPLAELPEAARSEAMAWDRLLASFRTSAPEGATPPWLEERVMAEIRALPTPGPARRLLRWLVRPRPLEVSPALAGLAAVAVFAALLTPVWRASDAPPPVAGPGPGVTPVVYVQFVLRAPGARSVSVGGDFDGWEGTHALADPDGDGTWTGRVPVGPGVHSYMFLVDGSTWITDPNAERYADDGFGGRNAILAVAAPST
jgi:hypothetical protein